MEHTTRDSYRYTGLGFAVIVQHAPMIKMRGQWVLDLNLNELQERVFRELAAKPARLTGNEIRFIRHYARMPIDKFGARFGVTHPAVVKWEKAGDAPTEMRWGTEKDIRLFVLSHAKASPRDFMDAYRQLSVVPTGRTRLHRIDAAALAG